MDQRLTQPSVNTYDRYCAKDTPATCQVTNLRIKYKSAEFSTVPAIKIDYKLDLMMDDTTQKLFDLDDQLSPQARLIGIDLGSKTIGLALSDISRIVASPLETFKRTKFKENAEALAALCDTHNVGGLILGFPLNMDGSEGPRAQATRAYMRNWQQFSPLAIALWDERLSTAAVTRTLIAVDVSRQRRSQLVDKLAATYILQGALDRLTARSGG